MLLTPSPVTNCHTFSDPLPLERDVLYGRPLPAYFMVLNFYYGIQLSIIHVHVSKYCLMPAIFFYRL